MKKRHQRGFTVVEVLLVVLVLVILGGVGYYAYKANRDKNEDKKTSETTQTTKSNESQNTPKPLEKGTFGDKGEYGTFQAEGYTSTVKREEAFCETACKQYDYVFFNITKSENTKIFDFIKTNEGNSAVQDKAIGMGCLANGVVSYSNDSDSAGMKEYTIAKADTQKIMAATKEKPVRLDVERLQYTGGRGAPTCYSHFTTFKVIN